MRENSVYSGRLAYRALMSAKESRMATINGGVGHSNMQMMKNGKKAMEVGCFTESTTFLVVG
jgi:hypothetical protein